jgi:cell wall-associated NlpC family hydrolase
VKIADVCINPDADLQAEGDQAAGGEPGGTQTLQVDSFGVDGAETKPARKNPAAGIRLPSAEAEAALIPPPLGRDKCLAPPQTANANIDITTPKELSSAAYMPVGGLDIALIGGTDVNVRAEADKKSKSLCKVGSGDKVYIIGADEPWYYVSIPDKKLKGYVHSDFVDALPRLEIKGDDVRLREGPGTDAKIKTELDKGEVFCKLAEKKGWVKLASSASGVNGWVKAEYVKKTEKTLSRAFEVSGEDVNFRASPSVDAEVISQLPNGAKVNVFGRNEKWTYLAFGAQKGWMYSQYLSPSGAGKAEKARDAQLMAKNKDYSRPSWKKVGGTSIGSRLIDGALAMKGTPYVWGGESDSGVDCSGLIYKLLTDNGADASCLPRRASEQMAQIGLAVEKEDLEPGDLVFFSTYKPGPSHVGIYLGDGDFIHASSARHQVAISNLSEAYYKRTFCGARRITEDELKKMQ